MEKNHFPAIFAKSTLAAPLTWKYTWGSTMKRSHIHVQIVTNISPRPQVWKCIKESILEKSPFNVLNALSYEASISACRDKAIFLQSLWKKFQEEWGSWGAQHEFPHTAKSIHVWNLWTNFSSGAKPKIARQKCSQCWTQSIFVWCMWKMVQTKAFRT